MVKRLHWRLASVKATVATFNIAIHFVCFADLVLKISALKIFVKAFVGDNFLFVCHIIVFLLQFPVLQAKSFH